MTGDIPPDRFDVLEAARALRASWRAILVGLLAGGAAAAGLTWLLLPFQSETVYGLGAIASRDPPTVMWPRALQFSKGLTLPELKAEYARLDGERFRQFLAARHIEPDSTLERQIKRLVNPETRSEILQPLYGSTRADVRELGESSKPTENLALGMRIVVPARSGELARNAVVLLGEFVGQTVFGSQARGVVARRLEQYDSQRLTYENDLIGLRFNIATTSEKVTRLRALQREFPDNATTSRQVVSVAEGGARYLSPASQVVGMEATVADLRQQIANVERTRARAERLAGYYKSAQAVVAPDHEPGVVLDDLSKLIEQTFAADGDSDVTREARNEAALDRYALATLREQGLRNMSGPTPGWRDDSRIWKFGVIGALVGALLVAFGVLVAHAPWRSRT